MTFDMLRTSLSSSKTATKIYPNLSGSNQLFRQGESKIKIAQRSNQQP